MQKGPRMKRYMLEQLCLNLTHRDTSARAHTLSLSHPRERVSHGLFPLFWKIKQKIQEEAEQEAQRSDLINLRYFCEEKLSEFQLHYHSTEV